MLFPKSDHLSDTELCLRMLLFLVDELLTEQEFRVGVMSGACT